MQFVSSDTPKNTDALGVLGYLVVINKQVHSYQIDALTEYLNVIHLDINETPLTDIIEGKDEAISFITSVTAFLEEECIQRNIYYMLVHRILINYLNYLSGFPDEAFQKPRRSTTTTAFLKHHL